MKIERVSYQKAYVIGPYLQEKVGFEATLDPGEFPENALKVLQDIADQWHKENNPLFQPGAEVGPSIQEIQEQKILPYGELFSDIPIRKEREQQLVVNFGDVKARFFQVAREVLYSLPFFNCRFLREVVSVQKIPESLAKGEV